jgi:hypothetical protein
MLFAYKNMQDLELGEILCVSDADIQFFKPENLFRLKNVMESSDIEYMGQREQDRDHFNGGFFLLKKSERTLVFLEKILNEDLTLYPHAEQDVINNLLPSSKIKNRFLSRLQYLAGCMRYNECLCPKIKNAIVMHHATCAFNAEEKMEQMNFVRHKIGINQIDWNLYV